MYQRLEVLMPPTANPTKAIEAMAIACMHSGIERFSDHYQMTVTGVTKLGDVGNITCDRVIITNGERPTFMISKEISNGVNYLDTTWDGDFDNAIDHCLADQSLPHEWTDDWLVVHVEYHA